MNDASDFRAEQIRQMKEHIRREHGYMPYGIQPWLFSVSVWIGASAVIASVSWLFFIEVPKHETWKSQRQATYDRYMSQCLQDRKEYECVEILWRFSP